MEDNIHKDHRSRMRRQIMKTEDTSLLEHELLETLLFYVIPRKDTNPLAHRIINTFGSVSAAMESGIADLMKVRGVGERTAEYLCILGKFGRAYSHICHQPTEYNLELPVTRRYLKNLFHDSENEQVYILCIDSRKRIVKRMLLFEGTFESVDMDLKDMIRNTLLCDAVGVVCVHNHPSGNAKASYADKISVKKMETAFETVGIEFIDSIISAGGKIYSMAEDRTIVVDE